MRSTTSLSLIGLIVLVMAASSCCKRQPAPPRVKFEIDPVTPAKLLRNCEPGLDDTVVCDSRQFAKAGLLTLQLARAYEQTCNDLSRCQEHAANDVGEMQGRLNKCTDYAESAWCDWWAWGLGGLAIGAAVGLGVGLAVD